MLGHLVKVCHIFVGHRDGRKKSWFPTDWEIHRLWRKHEMLRSVSPIRQNDRWHEAKKWSNNANFRGISMSIHAPPSGRHQKSGDVTRAQIQMLNYHWMCRMCWRNARWVGDCVSNNFHHSFIQPLTQLPFMEHTLRSRQCGAQRVKDYRDCPLQALSLSSQTPRGSGFLLSCPLKGRHS